MGLLTVAVDHTPHVVVNHATVVMSYSTIEIRIQGTKTTTHAVSEVQLDAYGDVINTLPMAAKQVARLVLPVAANLSTQRHMLQSMGEVEFSVSVSAAAKETVRKKLDELVREKGNPLAVVEVVLGKNDAMAQTRPVLCRFVTNPQLMLRALETPQTNAVYGGQIPANIEHQINCRHNKFIPLIGWRYLRWWLFALLFALGCHALLFAPENLLEVMPPKGIFSNHTDGEALHNRLPPLPTTMSQAYELGKLSQELTFFEEQIAKGTMTTDSNARNVQSILEDAAHVLSRSHPLLQSEMHTIKNHILQFENHKGIAARVWGCFTFVNVMWVVAILGVTISFAPALASIFVPLARFCRDMGILVFKKIVVPVAEFLHSIGVFEVVGWIVCWFFVLDGYRFFLPETGFFITLTGCAFSVPCVGYSSLINGGAELKDFSQANLMRLFYTWVALWSWPLAVIYQSNIFGFVAVLAIFSILGFVCGCFGLGFFFGFHGDDAMVRSMVSAFCLLALFTTVRIFDVDDEGQYIKPFKLPIAIAGGFVLNLGILIYSSYWSRRGSRSYLFRNLISLFLLGLQIFAGSVFGLPGLANTAITFLFLWLCEKYTEFHFECKFGVWIFVFCASCVLYFTALQLHKHPEFLISLLS